MNSKLKNNVINKLLDNIKVRESIFEFFRLLIAICISFAIAGIVIYFTSETPLETIKTFITAPFASDFTKGKILIESVPLMFSGVAVCIMIHCGQFNMIGEGTFYLGGLIGAVVAINFKLPPYILPIVSILISGVISGCVGYAPAKLKSKLNVNEFVSSIMFNFIIFWVAFYLLSNVFIDPNYSDTATKQIPESGALPFLSFDNQVSSNLIIALVIVILGWVFLYKTKWGYAIRMTGTNKNFTDYSGISSENAIVYSQVIGASICGAGGAAFILGNYYRFNWKALPGYGFDGFIIAIIARNNPLLVPIVALFFGYINVGAMEMARLTDVTSEVVYIIQAIMIILVGAQSFLSTLKKKSINNKVMKTDSQKGEAKC